MVSNDVFAVEFAVYIAQMLQMHPMQVFFGSIFCGEGFAAFRTHKSAVTNDNYGGAVTRRVFGFTARALLLHRSHNK